MIRRPSSIVLIGLLSACRFDASGVPTEGSPPAMDTDGAPTPGTPDATPSDARVDAPTAVFDAAPPIDSNPEVACDFVELIEGAVEIEHLGQPLNSPDEDRDPVLTRDGLTLYFNSNRAGGAGIEDIWRATRANRDAAFSVPQPAAEFNTSDSDTRVSLSADQLVLVLASTRGVGEGGSDLWIATRDASDAPFSPPTPIAPVNSPQDEYDPALSPDGLRLYFSSNRGDDQDILLAERATRADSFGSPVVLANVSDDQNNADPAVTADELVLVMATGDDLFYATRASREDDFSAPVPMDTVNSDALDGDPFVTTDGCELYFFSNRDDTVGNRDLYRVRLGP